MATTLNFNGILYPDGTQSYSLNRFKRAIFICGYNATISITNQVNINGLVSTDISSVGSARYGHAAAGYGGDKAIFGYGTIVISGNGSVTATTNLVSNIGVVAIDNSGVGTIRVNLAAATYGNDKAIFGFGWNSSAIYTNVTNLVSNIGVVATDNSGVGTKRPYLAAAGYGGDKAIFGYGGSTTNARLSMTNLVSNQGVLAADTAGVGTPRDSLAAADYGGDKAIFGYGVTSDFAGSNVSLTNLVSNIGVVATDTTGVSTPRRGLAAAGYGGDKAIFGYGYLNASTTSITNLVSNIGVVATDTTGVGTARYYLAASGFGS